MIADDDNHPGCSREEYLQFATTIRAKEITMDANTIGFAIVLPAFIIFAIGLAVTVHRLPG
jgi:hypothetical protein